MLNSCQVGQYYTAKTLKKGEKQLLVGVESFDLPAISGIVNGNQHDKKEALLYSVPIYPALSYTVGTKRNFDYSFGVSVSGQFSYAMKFKLLENDVSGYAMAIRPQMGLGILPTNTKGLGSNDSQLWVKIPIVFTKEFAERSSLTGNVGYALAFPGLSYGPQKTQNAFLFGSVAYHIGKKNKFFVSLAFQHVKHTTLKSNISNLSTQLALGYIWHFKKDKK